MATGVLVVAVGEATRIVEFLMAGEKTYRAVMKLGEITDTQDAEGKILERRPVEGVGREEIEAACAAFTGHIRQVPPMYSALKKNGVSLHRLARQGIEVERASRAIEINRLTITAVDLPHVHLEIDCSKGTYIRTLAHDLGASLGPGAHLSALRRVRSGSFSETDCVDLAALEKADGSAAAALLPIREALTPVPCACGKRSGRTAAGERRAAAVGGNREWFASSRGGNCTPSAPGRSAGDRPFRSRTPAGETW